VYVPNPTSLFRAEQHYDNDKEFVWNLLHLQSHAQLKLAAMYFSIQTKIAQCLK